MVTMHVCEAIVRLPLKCHVRGHLVSVGMRHNAVVVGAGMFSSGECHQVMELYYVERGGERGRRRKRERERGREGGMERERERERERVKK